MKILHTADWHFGASLGNYSRIAEQRGIVGEIAEICERENIDIVVIAGDIFDTKNPSSEAEELFLSAATKLSAGKRVVCVIAGNHDNPEKLSALRSWAYLNGTVISALPLDCVSNGDYGFYAIKNSCPGYYELEVKGETVQVIALPYASEARLQVVFSAETKKEFQQSYADELKSLIVDRSRMINKENLSLFIGHMFVTGSQASNKEAELVVGGSYAVAHDVLPGCDYLALGHLHRYQKTAGASKDNSFYSGSPLQYSLSEINSPKCVIIADIDKKRGKKDIYPVFLSCTNPIELWETDSVEEAIKKCENAQSDGYIYLKINSERPMQNSEHKLLNSYKKKIVEIERVGAKEQFFDTEPGDELNANDYFSGFYKTRFGSEPSSAMVKLFSDIFTGEEGEQ